MHLPKPKSQSVETNEIKKECHHKRDKTTGMLDKLCKLTPNGYMITIPIETFERAKEPNNNRADNVNK